MGAQGMGDPHFNFYTEVHAFDRYVNGEHSERAPTKGEKMTMASALATYCSSVPADCRLEYFKELPKDLPPPKDGDSGEYETIVSIMRDFYAWRKEQDYDPTRTECDQEAACNVRDSQWEDDAAYQRPDSPPLRTDDGDKLFATEEAYRWAQKRLRESEQHFNEEATAHDATKKRLRSCMEENAKLEEENAKLKRKNARLEIDLACYSWKLT